MTTRILRPLLAASLTLCVVLPALAADAVSTSSPDGKKINLNQASVEQIAFLPRVGAKAAQRVVDYRKAKGPFARPEDLMEVKGFGEKKFEQLKPYLAVSGPTTLDSKVSSKGSRSARSGKARGASKNASSPKTSSHTAPVGQGQ